MMRTKGTGKNGILVATMLALLVTAGVHVGAIEAQITSLTGKVEVQLTGQAWQPAEVGMTVPVGASISTGFNSRADLEIGPATLQVRALSRMRIDELIEEEGLVRSDLNLQVGRVRADVRSAEGVQSEFRLSSPVATAAVRGTSFEFDGVNIQVESGTVQLANQYNESVSVGGGESSSTTGEEPPTTPAESREAATIVQAIVTGGDTTRTEGARTRSASGTVGGLRVDWTITDVVDYENF
ncbi:MAG: hypothetical protein EA427_00080 [Spirochaetaceae bacterium]|nr:MAG: hypothetical protein EA427_00080 [Spirochaetaceae bacterium]